MATPIRTTYAADTWHQISPGATFTQLTHNSGNGKVVYTQGATSPVGFDESTPINNESVIRDNIYFLNLEESDFVWLYPINLSADITVTTE